MDLHDVRTHTYSIVALDEEAGEMGIAVQSHWFNVGSVVPWARPGIGVVATQALANVGFGEGGLTRMERGKSAQEALADILAADEGRDHRQVALLDSSGRIATYTGTSCIREAGHHTGQGYSVQANMMRSAAVWPAMAEAFEREKGGLTARLLKALTAAEKAGGDIRGRQSAALLVVRREAGPDPGRDRIVDLRVEDHSKPLRELERLLLVREGYECMNRADGFLEAGRQEEALEEYVRAESLIPGNLEVTFWHAVSLVNLGRTEESLPRFRLVFSEDPSWRELLRRLPETELLKADPAALASVLSTGGGSTSRRGSPREAEYPGQ